VASITNSELRRALAERLRYYNELGIYDFYRREGQAAAPSIYQRTCPEKKLLFPVRP
jgi:hypothetical protein